MAIEDLFGQEDAPVPTKALDSGLLVTNHLNLLYMLSAGLVLPPAGFGGKYYQDTLGSFPGWIPLFVEKVSRPAINYSTREAGHLKPVLVEVALGGLSGQVFAYGEDGTRELRFPEQLHRTEQVIFVPAPLPTSWIKSIVYPSVDDKRFCEADAKDFGNVPITDFKGRSNKTLFAKATDTPWPLSDGPAEHEAPLQTPLAAGGAMAMLLHFGNQGELAVESCRRAFDPGDVPTAPLADPILAAIPEWMEAGKPQSSSAADGEGDRADIRNATQKRLFWGAIEKVLDWRQRGGVGGAEDGLLDFLVATTATLDPRLQAGTRKLCDTLSSLSGLADATASELFERHPTPMARAMILFCLRRDCADLLDFSHDMLREPDCLLAAILFGVRDGWLRFPLRLRAVPGLSDAVSHRMARMSHRIAGTELDLGDPPARPRPLRELFGDGSGWRSSGESAALGLARTQKWDCVDTRISLGRGEYRLSVRGGSAHIDMPGEPKISPRVDIVEFFDHLRKSRLNPRVEAKVRKSIRS